MQVIKITSQSLRIEAPGAVIHVYPNDEDNEGKQMTVITVSVDRLVHNGTWRLLEPRVFDQNKFMDIRIRKEGKEK